MCLAPLAQLAEHRTLNPQVPGSSPGGRTTTHIYRGVRNFELNRPSGVPNAEMLIAFTESANRLDDNLPNIREALVKEIGEKGMVDAAITISIFRSLNIAADSSGIRVDDEWEEIAAYLAVETSADRFPTSTNSPKVEARIHSMTNQK